MKLTVSIVPDNEAEVRPKQGESGHSQRFNLASAALISAGERRTGFEIRREAGMTIETTIKDYYGKKLPRSGDL